MSVDDLLAQIDPTREVEHRANGTWAVWPGVDVRHMATVMLSGDAFFSTITCVPVGEFVSAGDEQPAADPMGATDGGSRIADDRPIQGEVLRVIYHWIVDGHLVNIETLAVDGQLPTISDMLPAADWAERETRDYFGIDFVGRAETPPLVLREGDPPGLFTRTMSLGRDEDPAQTARGENQSRREGSQ